MSITDCTEVNAEEVILERGAGRRVVIVGRFPFVERVRQADVAALTGVSLINHTFDDSRRSFSRQEWTR